MDVIWQLLQFVQQRIAVAALVGGAILGLLLGLAIGWWWFPVEWSNATPSHLRDDFQNNYLVGVAEYYADTNDLEGARAKLGAEFWEGNVLPETLQSMADDLGGDRAIQLRDLAQALETTPAEATPVEAAPAEDAGGGWQRSLSLVCGAGLLVVALVGAVLFIINRSQGTRAESRAEEPGAGYAREVAPSREVDWGIEGPPLAQFVTTYTLGDDHYDPSFSIEMDNSEFMGECGVGVSETIGVGAPNKVTACEVWLFDKNDIRTVTMVLMSEYAFHDEALHTKLAPKGEPVLAKMGEELVLETKSLRVQARVVDVTYGAGNLPPNSFFEKLTIELVAWVRPGQEAAQPGVEADFPPAPPTL
ncbi:MAG: hypothetical protein B6I35_07910 [Anaerolineaceae bacterium 4572_32.2]|nr:MAG: hypothetical protein B6I35_07910 [Anaerolineaceae bacterium 4572_32.2]RLC69648.1 MAG: hypothetical protein DRI81_20175 [Chloroflexota bacterium]HEY73900.1 hypothetical protein [Thermoflexia bacterium]